MSRLLEVKKTPKPEPADQNWPASLYARPRRSALPPIETQPLVPDEILEGCRLAVQRLDADQITSVGVTSSIRGEGRTTIALGMALALAEYGFDAVLLELDLAQPRLGDRLAIAKYPGVVDLADGQASLQDVMRPVGPGLSVIPAGQLQGTVPRVLSQFARSEILGDIISAGRVVVADLPSLLGNSAGHQAANQMADVVLVVRAGVVPVAAITEAVVGLTVTPKVLVNGTHTRVPAWALRLAGI